MKNQRENAKEWEARCQYAGIVFYAVAVGLGFGGFMLAAHMHTLPGALMGAAAFTSGVLALLSARASLRWRRVAESEGGAECR